MKIYPLKFKPISKYRVWGGNKLNTVLKKGFEGDNNGESWEISDVKGDETKVANGELSGKTLKEISRRYKDELLGSKVYNKFGTDFPLLIKFIDAKTPLSIQVHPHDHIAKERHNSFGKNEMWYIMDADETAEIMVGFNQLIDKETYLNHLEQGNLIDVLNTENISKGDAFYIPTGRVHAIGAGVLLAEIQQTSDITYRIYDYNRVDSATGEERELHNDLAIDVIDFNVYQSYKTDYKTNENSTSTLIHTPYFKSNIFKIDRELNKDYSEIDSFVIYICTEGSIDIEVNDAKYALVKGECILIPASIKKLKLNPHQESKILEVYY